MSQLAIVTREDGTKQYQYVDSYDIMDAQLSQEAAGYNPLGASNTKGCANCNWFLAPGRCIVVAGTISPTGLSDMWRAEEPDLQTPLLVQIVNSEGEPDDDDLSDAVGVGVGTKDTLTAKKRNSLSSSQFAYVDASGEGHLPINDESHVKAAMSRWNQTKFESDGAKSTAKTKIAAAAKRYGIDASGFTGGKEASGGTHPVTVTHPRTEPDIDTAKAPGKKKRPLAGLGEPTPGDKFNGAVKSADLGSAGWPIQLLTGLRELVGKFPGVAGSAPSTVPPTQTMKLYRTKDDRVRFLTAWSNNFTDREGEIFPESAHKEYIEWADRNEQYPELWLWHTKGTKYGQVDWLDYTDGFVYASGLIDAGYEDLAEALVKEDCGVSHGFHGLQRGKEIILYRPFEISTLPRTNAAVWTTSFNIIGEGAKEMAFTQQKKSWLKEHGLDDAAIAAAETQATALSKSLRDLGIAYKDTDQVEEVVDAKAGKNPFAEKADEEEDAADAAAAKKKKAAAKEAADFQAEMIVQSTKQTEILSTLATAVATLATKVKALEATDDQKIAATIAARAPGAVGVSASKDETNVVDKAQTNKDAEWFGQVFVAPITTGAQ